MHFVKNARAPHSRRDALCRILGVYPAMLHLHVLPSAGAAVCNSVQWHPRFSVVESPLTSQTAA